MAGSGYKLYATGDILTAAQVNNYLQEQTVMVFADAATRTTALAGVVAEGMISYLKDTDSLQYYTGSAWTNVDTGASPLTTKGDIYGYSTTNARVPVGTNGQVFTADSTAATGVAWATPTGNGMTLLSTTTLSGASTTISSISGSYNQLFIVMRSVKPATDAVDVLLRFNSDSGSNYDSSAWDGSGNFVAASSITLMGSIDNATTTTGMTLMMPDYADTTSYKSCYFVGTGIRGAGNSARFQMTGHWANANAITSITLLPSSGNWTSGSVLIYGVK